MYKFFLGGFMQAYCEHFSMGEAPTVVTQGALCATVCASGPGLPADRTLNTPHREALKNAT